MMLLFINILFLLPVLDAAKQVLDVLCEGNLDFVYTTSAATGRVLATRSFSPTDDFAWTYDEFELMKLAQTTLHEAYFDEEAIAASQGGQHAAYLLPGDSEALEDIDPDKDMIDQIELWSTATVAETVADDSCLDSVIKSAELAILLAYNVGTGVEQLFCQDVSEYCWIMNMSGVRTLCSQVCDCSSVVPSASGFFQTEDYGCPGGCTSQRDMALKELPCEDANISTAIGQSAWAKYVAGMKSYVTSTDGYVDRIQTDVARFYEVIGITSNQISDVSSFMAGDGFWDELADQHYLLADGLPDPENRTECEFLTSNIILFILQIDVCDADGVFMALKSICPISCICTAYPHDCPEACFT